MAEMLYRIRAVTRKAVSFCQVDAEFLAAHEVFPWQHMPSWVPPSGGCEGFSRVDCGRAIAAGLPAEKEAEVLAAWHERDAAAPDPAEQGGEAGSRE